MIRSTFWNRTAALDLWSGIGAATWAAWVHWQPVDLASRQPYNVLITLLDGFELELCAGALGFLQIAAVMSGRLIPRHVMALAACMFWLLLSYGVWLSDRSSPGAAIYATTAAMNVRALCSMVRDER